MREPKDTETTVNIAFERNYDTLFRYCLACLDGDEQAAMDAVDNVFFIAKEKAEDFDAVSDKKRWLFRTAKNVVRNIQRKRRSYRSRVILLEPARFSHQNFADGTPLPAWEKRLASIFSAEDEALEMGELSQKGRRELSDEQLEGIKELLLQSLSEDERELIIARYSRGVSTAELSQRLGISKDAVRMRIARASMKLIEKAKIYFESGCSL